MFHKWLSLENCWLNCKHRSHVRWVLILTCKTCQNKVERKLGHAADLVALFSLVQTLLVNFIAFLCSFFGSATFLWWTCLLSNFPWPLHCGKHVETVTYPYLIALIWFACNRSTHRNPFWTKTTARHAKYYRKHAPVWELCREHISILWHLIFHLFRKAFNILEKPVHLAIPLLFSEHTWLMVTWYVVISGIMFLLLFLCKEP